MEGNSLATVGMSATQEEMIVEPEGEIEEELVEVMTKNIFWLVNLMAT